MVSITQPQKQKLEEVCAWQAVFWSYCTRNIVFSINLVSAEHRMHARPGTTSSLTTLDIRQLGLHTCDWTKDIQKLESEIGPVFFTGQVQREKKNVTHPGTTATWTVLCPTWNTSQDLTSTFYLWIWPQGAKNVCNSLPDRSVLGLLYHADRVPRAPFFSFPQTEPLSCEWDPKGNISLVVCKVQDWQNQGRNISSLGKLCPSCHFFLELRPRAAKIQPLIKSTGHPTIWGNGVVLRKCKHLSCGANFRGTSLLKDF